MFQTTRSENLKTGEVVEKINVVNGIPKSVVSNDIVFEADIIIASADYHHVEQNLLEEKYRNYSENYGSPEKMALPA